MIILAGGRATRLGGADKPGLVVGGRTLLAAVVAAGTEAGARRVVVVGPDRPGIADDARCRGGPFRARGTARVRAGAGPAPRACRTCPAPRACGQAEQALRRGLAELDGPGGPNCAGGRGRGNRGWRSWRPIFRSCARRICGRSWRPRPRPGPPRRGRAGRRRGTGPVAGRMLADRSAAPGRRRLPGVVAARAAGPAAAGQRQPAARPGGATAVAGLRHRAGPAARPGFGGRSGRPGSSANAARATGRAGQEKQAPRKKQ